MTNDTGLVERVNSGRNVADILNGMEREKAKAASRIAALEARLAEYDRLIDFWFSPWGAGKAAEWEDLDGDGPALSAESMLNCIRRRARLPNPPSPEGTG